MYVCKKCTTEPGILMGSPDMDSWNNSDKMQSCGSKADVVLISLSKAKILCGDHNMYSCTQLPFKCEQNHKPTKL